MLRDGFDVRVLHAPARSMRFVEALGAGVPIGAARERAAGERGDFDLAAVLALLLGHGAVCGLGFPVDRREAADGS